MWADGVIILGRNFGCNSRGLPGRNHCYFSLCYDVTESQQPVHDHLPMKPTIEQRLTNGQIVRVMFLGSLASPKLIEVAGLVGNIHGVFIDQEHSDIPHHQLELLLMACRAAGLDALARVAPTDYATVMRPMEAGASGVMAAMIRTVEQAKQVVSWAAHPPRGTGDCSRRTTGQATALSTPPSMSSGVTASAGCRSRSKLPMPWNAWRR